MDKLTCHCCGSPLEFLTDLGQQPLANKYPISSDPKCQEYKQVLSIYYCHECLYAHVPCSIDRSLFFEDYYYLSSVNRELVNHFEDLAIIAREFGSRLVLDVGSNDGIFLSALMNQNISCIGIDPSENVGEIANAKGLETIIGFFNCETASTIAQVHGRPDLITASSVFTHFEDPVEFFRASESILAENGRIIIEVEYLAKIVKDLGFERFYFDRPHYFSVNCLKKLGESVDMELTNVESIDIHGGSVRATFQRSSECTIVNKDVVSILESERLALTAAHIVNSRDLFKKSCYQLKAELERMKERGLVVYGFGCPARFSTITNFCGIDSSVLPAVVDDSPIKEGKFSPGMRVPIVSFESSVNADIYVVFAYEYIKSIRERLIRAGIEPPLYRPIPFAHL